MNNNQNLNFTATGNTEHISFPSPSTEKPEALMKTYESEILETSSETLTWILRNWSQSHETLVAANVSCVLSLGNPEMRIQFFLCPTTKYVSKLGANTDIQYYSLWVTKPPNSSGVLELNATIPMGIHYPSITKRGKLNLRLDGQGRQNALIVEDFIIAKHVHAYGDYRPVDKNLQECLFQTKDLAITLKATLFQLRRTDRNAEQKKVENVKSTELSMLAHIKNMYSEEDNFSDLNLVTKDNKSLRTHKFLLSARSSAFRKIIEAEIKKNDFYGSIKVTDVNSDTLVVILHWVYTGELHENVGNVMEQVVEVAVKYELVDLLKLVDKKVIQVCTTENMFQLYQLAKRIPLPTATKEVSAFIKEHV